MRQNTPTIVRYDADLKQQEVSARSAQKFQQQPEMGVVEILLQNKQRARARALKIYADLFIKFSILLFGRHNRSI